MVQTHEHVLFLMGGKDVAQVCELRLADPSARVIGRPGIQHDHDPASEFRGAAETERSALERRAHMVR